MASEKFIKLVRDRVGDPNDTVIYRRAKFSDDDFRWALANKLVEEALEYKEARSYNELIDVFEVIWAILGTLDRTTNEFLRDAEEERLKRGSFLNRMSMWIRRS